MITLLHQGNVFDPDPLGKKDILVLGEKIGAITDPDKIRIKGLEVKIIEAADKIVVPGFIDSHVHLLGGVEREDQPPEHRK